MTTLFVNVDGMLIDYESYVKGNYEAFVESINAIDEDEKEDISQRAWTEFCSEEDGLLCGADGIKIKEVDADGYGCWVGDNFTGAQLAEFDAANAKYDALVRTLIANLSK